MHASTVRQQIEHSLNPRVPGALTPRLRQQPERIPTGIASVDVLLGGGLPLGAISELVGSASSGRTTLALSFTAGRLNAGQVAAWIDTSDTLDPESAAAVGIPLEQLLWVRCGGTTARQNRQELSHADQQVPLNTMDHRCVSVDHSLTVASQSGGCGSPHPRSEARGLPEALQSLIGETSPPTRTHPGGNHGLVPSRRHNKSIGTPGAPNRSLADSSQITANAQERPVPPFPAKAQPSLSPFHWRSAHREEQVATDRRPSRRGDKLVNRVAATRHGTPATLASRCAEPQPKGSRHVSSGAEYKNSPDATKDRFREQRPEPSVATSTHTGAHRDLLSLQSATSSQVPAASRRTFAEAAPVTQCSPLPLSDVPVASAASAPTDGAMPSCTASIHALPHHSTGAATAFFKQLSLRTPPVVAAKTASSLRGLDQALRAADLLLQSGGFGVIVLDLASVTPEVALRIPLSTWFRFRAAAERARTCFVLLTQRACARSSAELVVDLQPATFTSSGSVMTGIDWRASVVRERFTPLPAARKVISIRKPPQSEQPGTWAGTAPWTPRPAGTTITRNSVAQSSTSLSGLSPEPHISSRLAALPRRPA